MSKLKKHFNQPASLAFYAFLAWMAFLALISVTNAFGQTSEVTKYPIDEWFRAQWEEDEACMVAVSLAKAIVIDNVAYVVADSGIDFRNVSSEKFEMCVNQMIYATHLLQEYTLMSGSEIEIAMGVAGYDAAMDWATCSSRYGK
jgi:hypothetical protein